MIDDKELAIYSRGVLSIQDQLIRETALTKKHPLTNDIGCCIYHSMNTNTTIRLGLGVLAALCLQISGNLYGASYLYQDDFSNNAGALNGRATASGFGNWIAGGAFQVGSGQITINSNTPVDYHAATFSLPTLTANDILSLSITVRPSGSLFTAFGFTPNSGQYVSNNGYNWIYFASGNPTIQFLRGQGPTGLSYSAALTNPALDFDASLPTTFEYTYSASAKTLSLLASNGGKSSTLLNNLDVSTTPLSGYSNFALMFQGQELDTSSNPANVDRLSVSIVPEPSTFSMLLLGLGAMTATYRRRCQTPRL